MRPLALLSLPVLLGPVLSACGVGEARTAAPPAVLGALPVAVATAELGSVRGWYHATGHLQAEQATGVVSRQSGEVMEIRIEEGQAVRAGDLLARLDAARARLQTRRALAELSKAEQALSRQTELARRGLVSHGSLEELQFDVEARRASYELHRLTLEQSEIRAPIDGLVSRRLIKIGSRVRADAVVFEIVDTRRLRIELAVPERDSGRLAAGLQAQLELSALPQASFAATVTRLSPAVDSATGTVRVTLNIDNDSGNLAPGMFARVAIAHEQRDDVVLIPSAALAREQDSVAVFVIEDDRAVRRIVSVGYAERGLVEIRSGLRPGERYIVSAPAALRDGAEIQPISG